jgi:hypothetical protein
VAKEPLRVSSHSLVCYFLNPPLVNMPEPVLVAQSHAFTSNTRRQYELNLSRNRECHSQASLQGITKIQATMHDDIDLEISPSTVFLSNTNPFLIKPTLARMLQQQRTSRQIFTDDPAPSSKPGVSF